MKLALLSLLLSPLFLSCGTTGPADGASDPGSGEEAARIAQGPPPVIVGTVIEASSGKPLDGARIVAPTGLEAVSTPEGRFELVGLALGTTGVLEARLADGRTGRIELLPLASGRLEVVIFVR